MTNQKEKRKVPELRFPEFSGEWEEISLGEVSDVTKLAGFEFTNHVVYQSEGNIIALRGLNVKNGKLDLDNVKYIDNSNLDKIKRSKLYIGDIIFTYVGTIGETAIINENDKFYLAPNVCRIRCSKAINPIFLKQQISTKKYYRKIILPLIATSSQPALSMENIRKFNVSFPNIEEQQKIGEFFSKLDRQIELEEKKLALLEEQKKGYMQKIFSQELRFKDENGEEYPEWEKTKFNKFLSVPLNQEKNSAVNKDKLLSVKLNLNGITKINQDKVLNIGSTVYYQRKSGQFIYGKQNFFNGSFYIIQEEFDGYYSSGDVPSLNINNSIIDNSFFLNYIGREVYYKNQEKYSSGTGSKRIHEQTLLGFEMNLPCMSEQKKIASFLENLNKQLETMNRKIINLKKLKNNYLHLIMV